METTNKMNSIFAKDLAGEMVSPNDPGYEELINSIWNTLKLTAELNDGYHTPEEVRNYLSSITGSEIDPSVTLLPPFYVDFGRNIRMGKGWIPIPITAALPTGVRLLSKIKCG